MKDLDKGSSCVLILEKVWKQLQVTLPDLPDVIILLSKLGERAYFGAFNWHYSKENGHILGVNVSELNNAKELLHVLLHEAAHAINKVRGINDVTPDKEGYRYYHNKWFKKTALELGIGCNFANTRYGWTSTYFVDSLITSYPKPYKTLIKSFTVEKTFPSISNVNALPKSGHSVYTCKCKPQRRISMTTNMATRGDILCSICNKRFIKNI